MLKVSVTAHLGWFKVIKLFFDEHTFQLGQLMSEPLLLTELTKVYDDEDQIATVRVELGSSGLCLSSDTDVVVVATLEKMLDFEDTVKRLEEMKRGERSDLGKYTKVTGRIRPDQPLCITTKPLEGPYQLQVQQLLALIPTKKMVPDSP